VLHIGKTFVTVKLIATGGTTTRLPRNLKIVKKKDKHVDLRDFTYE